MSLLFRNWLDEGYYEEDEWGNLYKVEDLSKLNQIKNQGNLYLNDGIATTKVNKDEEL